MRLRSIGERLELINLKIEGNEKQIFNNDTSNTKTYGYLYDWETAKISCPKSWHLPKNAEWTTLIAFLGGKYAAGGKLREAGTTHWNSPNTGATDSSGFTALRGGSRLENGIFRNITGSANFWSSQSGRSYANIINLLSAGEIVSFYSSNKANGFSVRCLQD